jgi:hypothetical protein
MYTPNYSIVYFRACAHLMELKESISGLKPDDELYCNLLSAIKSQQNFIADLDKLEF